MNDFGRKTSLLMEHIYQAGRKYLSDKKLSDIQVWQKDNLSLLSEFDLYIDEQYRSYISSTFNKDSIFSEESSGLLSDRTWIVDPIDGTGNFVNGIPIWSSACAYAVDGRIVSAFVIDFAHQERFFAADGGGLVFNGRSHNPPKVDRRFSASRICFGFAHKSPVDKNLEFVKRIWEKGAKLRLLGCSSIALTWLSLGRLDGFVEFGLPLWDRLPGCFLASSAGLQVNDEAFDLCCLNADVIVAKPSIFVDLSSIAASLSL